MKVGGNFLICSWAFINRLKMRQESWNPNKVAVLVPDRSEKASDARVFYAL